jgi:hypothetical protein
LFPELQELRTESHAETEDYLRRMVAPHLRMERHVPA